MASSYSSDGREESDPEAILDHVQRDLAAADRALDEAHDGELGLVEHEAVARVDRQRREGLERVGRRVGAVAGQALDRVGRRRGTARASAPCARR